MASLWKEIDIDADPASVWSAVRDVGAVHRRLVPGLVTDVRLEGDARIVAFANGMTVRELIVGIDDARRRLAYAAVGGGRTRYHAASMQVLARDGGGTRLVWTTDLLPDDVAGAVFALMEQGGRVMKATLESEARAAGSAGGGPAGVPR